MAERPSRDLILAIPDLRSINADIAAILAAIAVIQAQIAVIQGQITTIQAQIVIIQGQITTIQGQITTIQGQIVTIQTNITDLQADVAALALQEIVDAVFTVDDVRWQAPQFTVPPPVPAAQDNFTARAIRQGSIVQIYTNTGVPNNISNFMRSPVIGQSSETINMTHTLPAQLFPRDGTATFAIGPMRLYDDLAQSTFVNGALTIRSDGTATMAFDQVIFSSVATQNNVGYMAEGWNGSYSVPFILP